MKAQDNNVISEFLCEKGGSSKAKHETMRQQFDGTVCRKGGASQAEHARH